MGRKRTRIRGWFFALTAVIFLAFGPALAPVLSGSSKNSFIEICTAFGAVKMAVSGDESPDQESGDHALSNHCVFCQSRLAALPPPPQVLPPIFIAYLSVHWTQAETNPHPHTLTLSYDPTGPPVSS